tara:strand:+ start:1058 stop:1513 length:456 start_codon:yes stop_codon:yes gene_type:complete
MAKEIMDFERCKKEFIRNVDKDTQKIKSMLKMAKLELEIILNLEINSNTSSKLAKDYYEIIKELLIALLLSHGLKSSNHECLISFFIAKYPKYGYEARALHELKNIRNRVSYDGYFVDEDYIIKNSAEFKHIIDLLRKLIKDNVPNLGQLD